MHLLSTILILAGLLLIAWAVVVWRFGDPVTALWYRYEQQRLEASYQSRADTYTSLLEATPDWARIMPGAPFAPPQTQPAPSLTWPELRVQLPQAAARYTASLAEGGPVGEIVVPRLGLHTMVVDGTSSADLHKGPGLDRRTSLPGRGRLVYIAGHRTTFGAPFAAIDTMEPGDEAELRLPYATFRYVVTGHRIVGAGDIAVLSDGGAERLVLQACHPRFFATHRYLVDARLVAVVVRDHGRSRTVRVPTALPSRSTASSRS